MLNRLVDLIVSFLHLFRFWFVVEPWEHAFKTTLGRDAGTLGKDNTEKDFSRGLNFRWPFNIDEVHYIDTLNETADLGRQDLTTSDGISVTVAGMFRYQIRADKIREFTYGLGDETTAIIDYLQAAVALVVETHPLEQLLDPEYVLAEMILEEARKSLNKYGLKLHEFRWTQKTAARTYRLITGAE